jgi:2-polyprenyl-3-methyl-5-hydroxy-6-metoxy-1,4-benzoquinol methylase
MSAVERIDIFTEPNPVKTLRAVERYIWAAARASGHVVDIACSYGFGSFLLSAPPPVVRVIGVDKREDAVEECRKRYGHVEKLRFRCADAMAIPGGETIVCLETLEHLEDPRAFLTHCFKVLDTRGSLLLSVPLDEPPGLNEWHLHCFSEPKLMTLLREVGLVVTERWLQTFSVRSKMKNLVLRARKL